MQMLTNKKKEREKLYSLTSLASFCIFQYFFLASVDPVCRSKSIIKKRRRKKKYGKKKRKIPF